MCAILDWILFFHNGGGIEMVEIGGHVKGLTGFTIIQTGAETEKLRNIYKSNLGEKNIPAYW